MICSAEIHDKQYTVYDSEDRNTTKTLDLDACVSNNNYKIKKRMKDVKFDEESDRPVLLTKLNTIRSNVCMPLLRTDVQNRNALSPPSCMMQEAEQRSTLSICTNEEQPEAHVQVNYLKNSSTISNSPPQVDEGLTAAAQSTTCRSTLTLGKGVFYTRYIVDKYFFIDLKIFHRKFYKDNRKRV